MILFWIICVIMLALATAFVLWASLIRDRTNTPGEQDISHLRPKPRSRNQHRLNSLYTPLTLAIFLPIAAIAIYYQIGTPSAIAPPQNPNQSNNTQEKLVETAMPSAQSMIDQLKVHLSSNPDDEHGWSLLAQSMMSLGNHGEAINAYEQLLRLVGKEPHILILYADALAMSSGSFTGKPTELLREALSANPLDPMGLWLSGVAAQERGEYKEALGYWYQLKPILAKEPGPSEDLRVVIDRAEKMLGPENIERKDQLITSPSEKTSLTASQKIEVRVSINPSLATQLVGNDVLFVYARAPGITRPIAAVRHTVSKWPVDLVLDESSSILAGTSLFDFASILIGAHISSLGDAISQSGDLVADPITVKLPNQDSVQIKLSRILP